MKKWWLARGILTVWAGVQPVMVGAQVTDWETWELSGVIWCGHPAVWNVDSTSHEWPIQGTDENDLLVSHGPYVDVVQWIKHSTGRRGVDRCMVAVAPRQ